MKRKNLIIMGILVLISVILIFSLNKNFANFSNINNNVIKGETKEFIVIAKQFEFNPGIIEVNEGDLVRIKIKTEDVSHSISISEFGVNEKINIGEEKIIEFVADKKGEFSITCNVFCGLGHREMTGKLIVK